MAGPVEALEAHCDNYVVLKPGFAKKEAARKNGPGEGGRNAECHAG